MSLLALHSKNCSSISFPLFLKIGLAKITSQTALLSQRLVYLEVRDIYCLLNAYFKKYKHWYKGKQIFTNSHILKIACVHPKKWSYSLTCIITFNTK